MKLGSALKLVVSLILPLLVGGIAGRFTATAIPTWYATLQQPSFSPPNGVFIPVWTFLYLLMGFSFFLVWIKPSDKRRTFAIIFFIVQLLLNFAWSFLFFYFRMTGWALVEIVLLWISILIMLFGFYRVRPMAAYINIPYLIWVSFATVLNAAFFILN
jgi:translocator protein